MTTKTQTTSQKLLAWNMSDGGVEIHAATCSDRPGKRAGRRGKDGFYGSVPQEQVEFGRIAWTSKAAFAEDYWSDINAEHEGQAENNDGSDLFYTWDNSGLDWKPCVTLRDTEEATEAEVNAGLDEIHGTKSAARSTSDGANAMRAEVRQVLFNSLQTALEGMQADVKNGYQPQVKADMMAAQVARVAHMFGLDK